MKRRQQRKKRVTRATKTTKTKQNPIRKAKNIDRTSSKILTKDFEIFVTDFLTDPCGLPVELQDCVFVDGTKSFNDLTGSIDFVSVLVQMNNHQRFSSVLDLHLANNNNQVFKKMLSPGETIDKIIKSSTQTVAENGLN